MQDGPPTLATGTVVSDKWRIEGLLGVGGMGAVYAARHVRNGREVALKLLHPEVAADRGARERFLQEGYAANKVGHPGTVQVLDDGVSPEGAFLVMERLSGVPVDKLAEAYGEQLPLLSTLGVLDAALAVLAAAHQRGIVHRDLKPENLFLTSDGQVKVLDFGIARVREVQGGARLTATGVPMGTPAFMPPEQAMAHWEHVDARSDVFAMGATAFTLLTGRLVHEARTAPELLVRASTQQARPLRSVMQQVPEAIANVIDRSLAFTPTHRYADAMEMRAALSAAARQAGVAIPAPAQIEIPSNLAGPMSGQLPTLPQPTPATLQAIAPPVAQGRDMVSVPLIQSPHGTVAPTTTPSERVARRRSTAFALGGATVIGVGLALGAFYVVGKQTGPGAGPADPAPAVGGARPSAAPDVTPTASGPSPDVAPQVEPDVAPSAVASASAAAVAGPAPTGTTPRVRRPPPATTSKPAAGGDDPLGNYRPLQK